MSTPSRRAAPRSARAAVEAWFFDPIPAQPVAITRIGLGLCLIACYLLYIPYLEPVFGPHGVGIFHTPTQVRDYDPLLPAHLWTVHAMLLGAAVAFTLGFRARLFGLVLAFCHALFLEVTVMHTWGWSRMMVVFLIYVSLSNPSASYSVDRLMLRRAGIETPETVSPWSLRLLMIHISIIYLSAGWTRLFDPGWLQGEMIFVAMSFSQYSRFPHLELQPLKPVLVVFCWAAWAIEMAAPLLLWLKRTRVACVVGLIAMHLGLELSTTIGFWQLMMVSTLCVFLPAELIQTGLARVTRWWRSGPGGVPAAATRDSSPAPEATARRPAPAPAKGGGAPAPREAKRRKKRKHRKR